MRPLSEVRARLLRARTSDEVLGTLGDVLVPAWADGLRVVERGTGEPVYSRGSVDSSGAEPFPSELWGNVSPTTVWLSAGPAESGAPAGWTAVDTGTGATDLPPARQIAVLFDMVGAPATVVLNRAPGRAAWTAAELSMGNECARLAEFALSSVQQHRRMLEARAMGDAAAHRWAAFARLSERLARSMDFDDVATAVMNAVVHIWPTAPS